MLVEGLGTGGETSIEEYIICPTSEPTDHQDKTVEKDHIRLYGHEEGLSWVAKPVTGRGSLVSHQGSLANIPLMDPLVTLFGSVHENLSDAGSKRSMFLPNMGSMIGVAEYQGKHENFDVENQGNDDDDDDYASDSAGTDDDENLRSPLLSHHQTNTEKDNVPASSGSILGIRSSSLLQGNAVGDQAMSSTSVGGGWQLVWKWSDRVGKDGKREGGLQRIYLHQEGSAVSRPGSFVSAPGVPGGSEYFQAAALVSNDKPVGPEILQQSTTLSKGPTWKDLLEPGVKRALIVGIGLQILQQVTNLVFWCRNFSDLLMNVLNPFMIKILLIILLWLNFTDFWDKWGSVLHSSDSRASRCICNSFKYRDGTSLCIFVYKCHNNTLDASLYSYFNVANGYLW